MDIRINDYHDKRIENEITKLKKKLNIKTKSKLFEHLVLNYNSILLQSEVSNYKIIKNE